jgi:hypothetical protein
VKVDLASAAIDRDKALRRRACDQPIAEVAKQLDDAVRVGQFDHHVEVVVLTRLALEQRINSPAAIQPHADPLRLQHADNSQQTR